MTAKIMKDNFLLLAAAYGVHKRLSESTVSKQIHGNQAFIGQYRKGQTCPNVNNYFRMIDKMREDWPPDAAWPDTSPIPKLGKSLPADETPAAETAGIS